MAVINGNQFDLALFRRTYRSISQEVAKGPWPAAEPFRSCLAAEFHRQFCKPKDLRLVLLAESHVFTDVADLACTLRLKEDARLSDIQDSPSQFVRLIYCLGYGENAILRGKMDQPNAGTPQYWKIFAECAGTSANYDGSLSSKVCTLQALKARGIWLADASIHACMNPRFTDPRRRHLANYSKALYRRVLNASWKYVKTTISSCPEVWIIGKGVRGVISCSLLDHSKWIYQPNGARTVEARRQDAVQRKLLDAISATCRPVPI